MMQEGIMMVEGGVVPEGGSFGCPAGAKTWGLGPMPHLVPNSETCPDLCGNPNPYY